MSVQGHVGAPHPGQEHIADLLNEVATLLSPLHQAIEEQGCGVQEKRCFTGARETEMPGLGCCWLRLQLCV